MKTFDVVVAADSDLGIALDGDMPWHVPGDLKWFKQLTSTPPEGAKKNTVFMGRKTWESIPKRFRPLSGRLNIVITRQSDYLAEGAIVVSSIGEALEASADGHIFCVGGGEIYAMALAMAECRRIYMTRIHRSFGCDTFFPKATGYDVREVQPERAENGLTYDIATLERI